MKKSALKQLIREAIEEVKPKVEEEVLNEEFSPETDEIGAFWITEMPTLSSTIEDIVIECKSVADFANKFKTASLNNIAGVFKNEAKAKKLGEKLLAERDKKKTEAKKAGDAYKKMKEEALAKVQEYMKHKGKAKQVVDELTDVTKA